MSCYLSFAKIFHFFVVVFSFVSIKDDLVSVLIKQQEKEKNTNLHCRTIFCFVWSSSDMVYAVSQYVLDFLIDVAFLTRINFNLHWMTYQAWIHSIGKIWRWLECFATTVSLWSIHVFFFSDQWIISSWLLTSIDQKKIWNF